MMGMNHPGRLLIGMELLLLLLSFLRPRARNLRWHLTESCPLQPQSMELRINLIVFYYRNPQTLDILERLNF